MGLRSMQERPAERQALGTATTTYGWRLGAAGAMLAALMLSACAAPRAPAPGAVANPAVPREQGQPVASQPTAPEPASARSADIIGLGTEAVERLLGRPEMVRRDAPAEVWQYRSETCVVDLYLYPAQASYRVAYIEARDPSAASVAADNCFATLPPRQSAI